MRATTRDSSVSASASSIGATACRAAILVAVLLAPIFPALATNVVLGDSNSTPRPNDFPVWPELLFGDDHINHSFDGMSTYDALRVCEPDECWWLNGTSEDDVWWILLGTNDLRVNPDSTAWLYGENMLAIIDLIPAREIHLISSAPARRSYIDPLNVHLREQAYVDALICEADPRVDCAGWLGLAVSKTEHFSDAIHLNEAGHRAVAEFLAVPEPDTGMYVGTGIFGVARARTRRRRRRGRSTAPPPCVVRPGEVESDRSA